MKLCMFSPVDQELERGWPGRVEGDKVIQLAAQTLQSFFTGGGSAREHAEYDLADVDLRPPVLHPPSVRDFMAFEEHVANARRLRGSEVPKEWYEVPELAAQQIAEGRSRGAKTWAVGTTSVRTLESAAAADGTVASGSNETSIFIRPPYTFRAVDHLLTNFHLPHSTLIMLVAAFAGFDLTMRAYATAVEERYRFFSYGDAMLIL